MLSSLTANTACSENKRSNTIQLENTYKDVMNENLVKINSAHVAKEIGADKYSWSISNYFNYFYSHKLLISIFAFISFSLAFTFFFNKEYNTKISYIINTNQSFQSNILASGFIGKSDNNVFTNLVERSYNHAKSRRFVKQLSAKVLESKNESYIYQLVSKDFQESGSLNDIENENLLIITDFLEKRISVKLKDENQIVFSITTKDSLLTESVQKLINDNAKDILTAEPLTEVVNASNILSNQLSATKKKLEQLDDEKITIQESINSIDPLSLAGKFANIESNIEKELYNERSALSTFRDGVRKALQQLRVYPNDYSTRERLNSLHLERENSKSKIKSLESSLLRLKKDTKDIPKMVTKIEKIKREQEILVRTALNFTEKESLAAISIQKIRESISLLSAEENIKSSKSSILIIKAILVTVIMLGLIFTGIYYKQEFFPVIMTRDEFERTQIPVSTAFSSFSEKQAETDLLITVNNVAQKKVSEEIKNSKLISFMNAGKTKDSELAINMLLKKMLSENKSVFILNFNLSSKQRRIFRELAQNHPEKFNFQNINENFSNKSILNIDKIKEKVQSEIKYDHIVLNLINVSSIANKALIASISQNVYAFATLNKTRYSQINNFVKLYNVLSIRSYSSIKLILTRSKSGDNISSFLNEQINQSGMKNENNSKAS